MGSSEIVPFEDLQKASGYENPHQIAAWLERNQIKFFYGKHNRPCTTAEALKRAMFDDEPKRDIAI